MSNRKFQHTLINVVFNSLIVALSSLFVLGFVSVVFNLLFNDPTITFGGF